MRETKLAKPMFEGFAVDEAVGGDVGLSQSLGRRSWGRMRMAKRRPSQSRWETWKRRLVFNEGEDAVFGWFRGGGFEQKGAKVAKKDGKFTGGRRGRGAGVRKKFLPRISRRFADGE
jgi:hypothetical protein